jgi:hypothetical protein
VVEILHMQESGIISEDENFELIGGGIVSMQARNHVHVPAFAALPCFSAGWGRSERPLHT